MKPKMLYIDQWGNRFWAATIKALCREVGRSKARRMYVEGKDGKTYHTGYVVGKHWLSAYTPMRNPQ